jgi:hypothetical protein
MIGLSACGRFSPANLADTPEMLFACQRQDEFKPVDHDGLAIRTKRLFPAPQTSSAMTS